jgi:outer membrane protein OmpA-like peptidoglycan-associated protein
VIVSGTVGTAELESRIRRELVSALPGRTLDLDLAVEDVGEPPVSWPSTFEPLFSVAGRRIGDLDLTLDARVLTVEGTVVGEAAVDSLGAQFIGTAPGVRLHNALQPGESAQSRLAAALSGPPLRFEEGSARLDARARTLLAGVAQVMALSPGARISVKVWGDPAAGVASARRVGRARAEAIVRFLAQRGVDRGRMTFEGMGPPDGAAAGSSPTVEIALSEG